MPNLNSEKYEKFVKALFVGPTGRGKTIAASSWPGKTMIYDFDDRHRPVIDWYSERVKNGDFSVESIHPRNFWTTFVPSVKALGSHNPYDNIIVDGITTLTTTTVTMQMIAKGSFDNWFEKRGTEDAKGQGKVTSGGIAVPGWDEFNGEAMIVSTLLETLKSFKCNVFITAHPVQRTRIDPSNKKSSKYTSLVTFGPKVESLIPTYFDEVWYFDYKVDTDSMGRELIKRTCYTHPSEDYMEAKTAMKIPKEIDYTDKNLYDVIKDFLKT